MNSTVKGTPSGGVDAVSSGMCFWLNGMNLFVANDGFPLESSLKVLRV